LFEYKIHLLGALYCNVVVERFIWTRDGSSRTCISM